MQTHHLFALMLTAVSAGGTSLSGGEIDRIAILGCLKQNEPAPALVKVGSEEPDLCLWIGDNVYADTETSPEFLRSCYATLAAKPGFQELRAAAPWAATWDDHDFGLNNAGGEYPLKNESKAIFREFWKLTDEIPVDRDGVYYAKMFSTNGKNLQLILLDPRFNRAMPGPDADTLGEQQWAWLSETLAEPADLRLLVSGFQVLLDAGTGSETWAEFPAARQRLFDTIRKSGAEHLVLLTGDQHYGEVCRLTDALGYDAVELQFAGLNQIETPEFNSLRVSPVSRSKQSYALLDIQWRRTAEDAPHLLFRVVDAEQGRDELVYRVNFAELEHRDRSTSKTTSSVEKEPSATTAVSLDAAPPHSGHAHNDYQHPRPFFDAVEQGFASVEADVFLRDGELLVGHAISELRPGRTLSGLYLDPIRERLEATGHVSTRGQPFTLLVDIKADGPKAYPVLAAALAPLRPFLVGDGKAPPSVRVIVSGDRPIDQIAADPERLVGIDGRLEDLGREDRPASLVPLISDRWGKRFSWVGDGPMPAQERLELERIVAQAHERGQEIRFWATPDDPAVWRELMAEEVDLVGCDDLDAFRAFILAGE
jgi:hypothetical protein